MFTFPHLPRPLALRVCYFLDLKTLLRLRRTSKALLDIVTAELEDAFIQLLSLFVPDPQSLSEALVDNQSFVGGSVALAFILRDSSIIPNTLDIFIPRSRGMNVENHLAYYQSADEQSWTPYNAANTTTLGARRLGQIVCTSATGGRINLYESSADNALVPICLSWATHLVIYVNGAYFGTGYPNLLQRRRAILGQHFPGEVDQLEKYERRGFDIRFFSRQWVDMQEFGCGASQWSCATQERRFDDAGSLKVRVRPLDPSAAEDDVTASVVWRLDTRPCGGACSSNLQMDAETTVIILNE